MKFGSFSSAGIISIVKIVLALINEKCAGVIIVLRYYNSLLPQIKVLAFTTTSILSEVERVSNTAWWCFFSLQFCDTNRSFVEPFHSQKKVNYAWQLDSMLLTWLIASGFLVTLSSAILTKFFTLQIVENYLINSCTVCLDV